MLRNVARRAAAHPVKIALEDKLSYQIATLAGLINRQSTRLFAPHGVSVLQWRVLHRLETSGPQTPSDLLPATTADGGQLSREIADLELRGYVRIEADTVDRRRKIVSLTRAGRLKHEAILPDTLNRQRLLSASLSEAEYHAFMDAARKLKEFLQRDLDR